MLSQADRRALRETFLFESEEGLATIEQALVELEERPDAEGLDEIFRTVHTLKGDAGSVGFEELSRFAHAVEDVLESIRDGRLPVTSKLVTLLLKSVDALRDLMGRAARGAGGRNLHGTLRDELERAGAHDGGTAPARDPARELDDIGSDPSVATARQRRATSLRVSVNGLDALLTTVGEISVARGQLTQLLENPSTRIEHAYEIHLEADRLHLELQEIAMKLRMVPIGPTFEEFRRAGRDLALRLNKKVSLAIRGSEVEVDNSVLQLLKDPLSHMFRNALDHGIEMPEARRSAGKDPTGLITLNAYHQGGQIVIECEDDGAGLYRERIAERARASGHARVATDLTNDAELLRLLVKPGFSTVAVATGLSGRGVGMDLVRRNVDALRGSVALDSKRGKGTRITLRVPLTLSIIEGLLIRIGREAYVLALDAVVEALELPTPGGRPTEDRGVVTVRDGNLPYVRLRSLFDSPGSPPPRENLIVVRIGDRRAGLVVDEVTARVQAVIKPLAKLLQEVRGISSCTILGDGTVALILDVETLLGEEVERRGRTETRGAPC